MSKFDYPPDNKDHVLEDLVGTDLPGGWKVTKRMSRKSFQSGSCFSVGYLVVRGNETAFMKAFDFWDALQKDDVVAALNQLTQTYLFERELLRICGEAKMSKVVKAISDGTVADARAPLGQIFYLLFELADGDVRAELAEKSSAMPWRLRCLHNIATALLQLHKRGIYHQDLKPSNVLVFTKTSESKLGDLGRAHHTASVAPHDGAGIPGALRYAPPELLYGAPLADPLAQKRASDLYLFGSMLCFFATGLPMTPLLLTKIDPAFQPFLTTGSGWRGFYGDVIAHLTDPYDATVDAVRSALHAEFGAKPEFVPLIDEAILLLRYCTNLSPTERGHPAARRQSHGNPYDLQRIVSATDLLATRASVLSRSHA